VTWRLGSGSCRVRRRRAVSRGSSASVARRGRVSGKRGNRYLRKNLVHGARAVFQRLAERDTPIGRWLRGLLARQHNNVVIVARANKLARICWAVLAGEHQSAETTVTR
jgi:transposase